MYVQDMRVVVLARHGQSLFNVDGVVNGDPARNAGLSPLGATQSELLQHQLAPVTIDLCVTSSFPRAQQTAELALGARGGATRKLVDTDLDDVRIGRLEGQTLDEYRAWKHAHGNRFPGGESLDEAAHRYADAFERLLAHAEETILCVCHEIPVRYAVNAAAGSTSLDAPLHDIPNATPYLFDAGGLRRALARMRELART